MEAAKGFLTRRAKFSDLAVIPQVDGKHARRLATEPEVVAFSSGRPVLVLPRSAETQTIGNDVVIAWDDSREAARALSVALPFIENAKRVTLISVGQKDRDRIDLSVVDIAHHLARHGVKPEIVFVDSEDALAGPTILAEAEARRSDLVVMGHAAMLGSANCCLAP
jgi:hypothetical protein